MRRKERKLSEEDTLDLLRRGTYGVLATVDRESGVYGVPISYIWKDGAIYIHSALKGHKVENIKADNRVSFTVVGDSREPVFDKGFSTYYESAIVKGRISEVTDEKEKYDVLYALAEKYLPQYIHEADANIKSLFKATLVCVVRPEAISGKSKRKMSA